MKLSKDARKLSRELFQHSFTGNRLDQEKVRLIARKIAEAKPRHYVGILKDYQRRLRLEVEKHHALIESAAPLDQRTRDELEKSLRAKYGDDLTTEFNVNPELIGGLRIRLGSNVWDSTISSRLDRLETQLTHA
jgi:F-type H+-transporting ATPase subunit delta